MEKIGTTIGSYAPDFELPGIDGAVHHLARYLEQYRGVGVIFMCNQCAYVKACIDDLKQIQAAFEPVGFTLIGINANDASVYPEDSFENMLDFGEEYELNFPYLRDPTQDVAKSFGAAVTPQAFLLDRQGVLRYCGSINDAPQAAELVQMAYLGNAIAQLLKGEAINASFTEPIGCSLIKWRA